MTLPQSLYSSAASPTVQKMVDHLLITFDEKAPQSTKGLRVFQLGLLWRWSQSWSGFCGLTVRWKRQAMGIKALQTISSLLSISTAPRGRRLGMHHRKAAAQELKVSPIVCSSGGKSEVMKSMKGSPHHYRWKPADSTYTVFETMSRRGAAVPRCSWVSRYRIDTGDHQGRICGSARSGLRRDNDKSRLRDNAEGDQEKSSQGISTSSGAQVRQGAEDVDVIDNSYSKFDYQINTKVLPLILNS